MIYEGTIQYCVIDKNGNDKQVKETYVIDEVETFGQVEELLYKEFQDLTDIDVVSIKRSVVNEIIKPKTTEGEQVWMAEVMQTFIDDNDVEKEMRYKFLFYGMTFDAANQYVREYMKQGYEGMELIGLKRTRIKDIFIG